MVFRSDLSMGPRQLARHPSQSRDSPGGYPEGVVSCRLGSGDRQTALENDATDEISTWGTPALVRTADGRDEVVTNGTKIRGYDPETGKLLWTLGPNSEVTVATPVAGHGLVFVTARLSTGTADLRDPARRQWRHLSSARGRRPARRSSGATPTGGTYIPTPLVYGDHLLTVNNNGVVTAYDARTGRQAFRGRVGVGGTFSASPVAADGRLFFASEDGEVYVVTCGPELSRLRKTR